MQIADSEVIKNKNKIKEIPHGHVYLFSAGMLGPRLKQSIKFHHQNLEERLHRVLLLLPAALKIEIASIFLCFKIFFLPLVFQACAIVHLWLVGLSLDWLHPFSPRPCLLSSVDLYLLRHKHWQIWFLVFLPSFATGPSKFFNGKKSTSSNLQTLVFCIFSKHTDTIKDGQVRPRT